MRIRKDSQQKAIKMKIQWRVVTKSNLGNAILIMMQVTTLDTLVWIIGWRRHGSNSLQTNSRIITGLGAVSRNVQASSEQDIIRLRSDDATLETNRLRRARVMSDSIGSGPAGSVSDSRPMARGCAACQMASCSQSNQPITECIATKRSRRSVKELMELCTKPTTQVRAHSNVTTCRRVVNKSDQSPVY
jgi:hypothetical protein